MLNIKEKILKWIAHMIMTILAIIASGQGTTSNMKPTLHDEQPEVVETSFLDGNSALPPDSVSRDDGVDEIKQRTAENLIDGMDAVAEEKRKQLDKKIIEKQLKRQKAENNYADVRSIYDISRLPTPPQKPENDK